MILRFNNMGHEPGTESGLRVDVWLDDSFVGELSLHLGDWEKLERLQADGELQIELSR